MYFLNHLHSDLRSTLDTRRGNGRSAVSSHDDAKSYPRLPHIQLPEPETLSINLSEALSKRTSATSTPPYRSLSLQDCSTLLGTALQKHSDSTRRNYPSGGNLYPIETYLITGALEGSAPAVFHYNPLYHHLETLCPVPEGIQIDDLARHDKELELEFTSLIVMTSVWERSSVKYGDFTYLLSLLEAGHMAQNLLLCATALGRKARPLLGFYDQPIINLLDIDPEDEQPVYSIALW